VTGTSRRTWYRSPGARSRQTCLEADGGTASGVGPGLALLDVDVVGQAEHALGDDVAENLGGAAADGEGRTEEEAGDPLLPFGVEALLGEHALRAEEVLGQAEHPLAVGIAEGLAQ